MIASWRDALLVARFEVGRAMRTRRALALIAVYLVAHLGGCWLFVQAVGELEAALAGQLGVASARWPGTMMGQLRESESLLRILRFFVGDEGLVEDLARWPVLAIFDTWLGLLVAPFFAATAAAESISTDVSTRALRYEALRTGRAEIVAGRFLGQVGLMTLAAAVSWVGVWALGMSIMVGHGPVELAVGLVLLGGRAVVYAIPFIGLGVAASQLTASSAWARVLALSGAVGGYVAYGLALLAEGAPWTLLADLALPLLPASWMRSLWALDLRAVAASAACVGLGVATVALAFLLFRRRDL